jgi:hypothetical protein
MKGRLWLASVNGEDLPPPSHVAPGDPVATVDELAELCGVSSGTVRRVLKAAGAPVVRGRLDTDWIRAHGEALWSRFKVTR